MMVNLLTRSSTLCSRPIGERVSEGCMFIFQDGGGARGGSGRVISWTMFAGVVSVLSVPLDAVTVSESLMKAWSLDAGNEVTFRVTGACVRQLGCSR